MGAVVQLSDAQGLWHIERLSLGAEAELTLSALPNTSGHLNVSGIEPKTYSDPSWVSEPVALAFDFPGLEGLQAGCLLSPFRTAELSFGDQKVSAITPVRVGTLLSSLSYRPPTLWDRVSALDIYMPEGVWFAVSEAEVFSGVNRFAIETETGWEIIAAADITLIGEGTYRFKTLLRGLSNSDDYMMEEIPAGARIVALGVGVVSLEIDQDYEGQNIEVAISAAGRNGVSAEIAYGAAHLRPLFLSHIRSKTVGGETELSWIPRNLDESEDVDPALQVEIRWSEGVKTVSGTTANIPVLGGEGVSVTLSPIDLDGRYGPPKTILV